MTSAGGLRYPALRQGEWDVLGSTGMVVELHPSGSTLEFEPMWHLDAEGLTVDVRVSNPSRQAAPFNTAVSVELNPVGESVQALIPAEDVSVHGTYRRVEGRLIYGMPPTVASRKCIRRSRWTSRAASSVACVAKCVPSRQ